MAPLPRKDSSSCINNLLFAPQGGVHTTEMTLTSADLNPVTFFYDLPEPAMLPDV